MEAGSDATDDFTLLTYLPPISGAVNTLTIHIEGDGLAWINSSTPSSDPTPTNPLALRLALLDTAPSVYLANVVTGHGLLTSLP